MNEPKFFICDCHEEGILVDYFDEDQELYVSFWRRGQEPHKFTFGRRLALAVKLIWNGTLYHDQVCLDRGKALQLAKFIRDSACKGITHATET